MVTTGTGSQLYGCMASAASVPNSPAPNIQITVTCLQVLKFSTCIGTLEVLTPAKFSRTAAAAYDVF
eukprot:SAG31_NODE_7822_length_1588_cov_65.753526_1_plen_67_part_00